MVVGAGTEVLVVVVVGAAGTDVVTAVGSPDGRAEPQPARAATKTRGTPQ